MADPKKCRRCVECAGMTHHWISNDECEGPDDPEFVCKHCDAIGETCRACCGDGGLEDETCQACGGEGVIALKAEAVQEGETP